MPPFQNLAGQKFGRLSVVRFDRLQGCNTYWLCECDCGGYNVVPQGELAKGTTSSCGCKRRNRAASLNRSHGMSKTRTYQAWVDLRRRCLDPTHPAYRWYGARGITVCERWLTFENFLGDVGEVPEGLSIDRINNDGNYEPSNIRWATQKQQVQNQRKRQRAS